MVSFDSSIPFSRALFRIAWVSLVLLLAWLGRRLAARFSWWRRPRWSGKERPFSRDNLETSWKSQLRSEWTGLERTPLMWNDGSYLNGRTRVPKSSSFLVGPSWRRLELHGALGRSHSLPRRGRGQGRALGWNHDCHSFSLTIHATNSQRR